MATINYKEKYEKAVRAAMLAKQDTESAVTIRILEEIFPELKESEDERIRKEILEYFLQFKNEELRGVNISDWIAWLEKQGEQKPAWSEEDEKIINGITSYLCTHDSCELDGFDKWYDFLKSLKDRVHPKQEWSEEDDFMVENVRNSFGLHYRQMTPALQEQYRKFFDKVKAIKLQPNWKPSKEQIKSLYNSIPDAALYEREILTQLYVDLKKLTE